MTTATELAGKLTLALHEKEKLQEKLDKLTELAENLTKRNVLLKEKLNG